MDFKAELIKRVTSSINLKMKAGKTLKEAIAEAKAESVAGPAVWEEVTKAFSK